jgi:hypothetical protein
MADPVLLFIPGGLQLKDAAPMVCGVVDNGVCADDPRVLVRLNEATKIVLDNMIPVGGMMTALVTAAPVFGTEVLFLPPEMENIIEAYPADPSVAVRGNRDIAQGWYEIINNSTYLDPNQHHDNPLIDAGLFPDPTDSSILRRAYQYPGLSNPTAQVVCTGARRFLPLTNDEDYLIVQNVEALKCIILSIERYENNDPDGAQKYRQSGMELLQAEVKKHIMDPRNYMRRKNNYQNDLVTFREDTLGWVRANIALDVDEAMKTGKSDLTWSINQMERRLMKPKMWKDTIVEIQANVVGGFVYFPLSVQSVLAVDLDGQPIPIRSQFFDKLDNGPGGFASHNMLRDMGDHYFESSGLTRRKYRLIAHCAEEQCISAVCKLRWIMKKPNDLMTIKNYEAIRLAMVAKFLEEKEDWQNAQINMQQAFKCLEDELYEYLQGIKHTIQIQTYGFGLGDVGRIGM